MVALWSVILAVTVILFIALHAVVMPKLFFKVRFNVDAPIGRGVKIVRETGGKSILYDSDLKIRKYISQYIISERDGKKQLVCRTDENIKYVDYDIVLFDNFNNVTDVMHVREAIKEPGYTSPVQIPENTAYATVYLNAADCVKFKNKLVSKITGRRWLLYLIVSAIVEILAVFTVRACLANIFGGIYREIFLYSSASNGIACAICALVIILNAVLTPLAVKRGYGIEKGEKA